ncbi:ABC transporter ATP-binding protein [Arcobacter sp. YIC-464]|uniref:ABC transporter ATP-binding protein n=1 Tax=Arcobacter sp. YIC-464 TaxID=3376631 RepID=UPI003C17F77D
MIIEVKGLSHDYNGDVALRNINLNIEKGEFISIIGESGSGKTTLLSILSTLLKQKDAELFFENRNYKDIKNIDKFRKENIGFIFQFHYLINYLTNAENVKIANEKALDKEVLELFKLLDISELLNKFPNEISGGQRQRVAIARALINKPKVIFADEPTGNLDSKNSLKVFKLFQELSKDGVTVIVATHDKTLAKMSHRIIEVKDGQIQ